MNADLVRARLAGADIESRAALVLAEALWANDAQDVTDFACRQAAIAVIALLEREAE